MEKITIGQAQKYTSPNAVSLVCALRPDGKQNLTTISWWTYLSNNPPMLGFAISKKSYTGELIRQKRKAILCVPGESLAEKVYSCGKISGREVDKCDKFGIELEGNAQYPTPSKVVFECDVVEFDEVGDHIFYKCLIGNILGDKEIKQCFAWDGYSKVASINVESVGFSKEEINVAFLDASFGNCGNRYVYNANTQVKLFKTLLLEDDNNKLNLHFTYLPRIIGLKSLIDKKEVKFQRGVLTFELKDGICHVTSKLEVSSQGVPTEYRGFAVITNPLSSGPACTCFLREINNAFGIFILFSFRLSSIEDVVKRKTRLSECMAVRKDDGTSFVYRLLLSKNFIEDEQMKYFAGFLKIGTDENTKSGNELKILIKRKYVMLAENFFNGNPKESFGSENAIYDELHKFFDGVNKNKLLKIIMKIRESSKQEENLLTINPSVIDMQDQEEVLFLAWLRTYSLSARHDKIEKVLDDNVEEIHKVLYPKEHLEENEEKSGDEKEDGFCENRTAVINFLSNELSNENVKKYNEKQQKRLKEWGLQCKMCSGKDSDCTVLKFYKASHIERREILS